MPRISIVVPVYEMRGRGVEFLNVLLRSVHQQTFNDYDIVISDNSVDDDIVRYLDSLPAFFRKRLHYTRNYGAKTISSNLNNGLHHASGELIKVILQDDAFLRVDALQRIAEAYGQNPAAQWCLEACVHTNDFHTFWGLMVPSFNDFLIIGVNTISSPSVVSFKRNLKSRFDVNLNLLVDVEFYSRQRMDHGEPIIVSSPLIGNRVWSGQTQRSISSDTHLAELIYIAAKYPVIVNSAYLARAKIHFEAQGDHKMTDLMVQLMSVVHQTNGADDAER
jgi:glycosyltransferase involved in cell wall biosynthesis